MGRHRTDELDDGYRAQDPGPRRRNRGGSGRGKVLVPLAGAVALAVLLGVAAFVIFNRDHDCSGGKLPLSVVAAPDIQPALQKIAEKYNKSLASIDSKCVEVKVAKENPFKAANNMASGKLTPDVWIADSSLMVSEVRGTTAGAQMPEPSGSVASSPVVLAAAKSMAGKLSGSLQPSWAGMIAAANVANPDGPGRKVRVLALDPKKNSAGLSALLAAAGAAKEADLDDKAVVGALKELSDQVVPSPDALLASLAVKSGSKVPVGVAAEQAIYAHNSKKPDSPIVPLYPQEGTLSLDYPLVITTKSPDARKAAEAFKTELAGQSAQNTLRAHGFRSPDGKAGDVLTKEKGFEPKAPEALKKPDVKTVASMAQSWSRLSLGTRMLALLDVSGTMAYPVPGSGMTRMQAITKIASEGLGLFEADSEIGVWAFSTHLQGTQDWRELISVGPLSESVNGVLRKEAFASQLGSIQAKPTGNTGLNDTLKAAYARMTEEYADDKINTVLVLTDGAGNDDPEGGIGNSEILSYLKKTYDPKRPVSILLIAFGPDAPKGKAQMDALAKATGGEAYIAKNILQVRDFFAQGMSRRLCAPRCDG
ncbi:substrate-binding and VWA domain-containing protein [Nonomuraea typhae]|uniref:substrate-binding and VWA domain-containing protein n=1 Tax=Nonomuraea typhae TaxID=2603600 RepID=UPI0012FB9DAD|nr:substrate-binding and VWA domain-containing protein [Nonomuraea typhae]